MSAGRLALLLVIALFASAVGAVTGGSWDDVLKTIEKARGKA